MDKGIEQEEPYKGLLGLDKLSAKIKIVNFIVTVIIGTVIALSWDPSRYFENAYPSLSPYSTPFSLPLIFLFPWPVCGAILWLRITGINWLWSILASVFILMFFFILATLIRGFMVAFS